MFEIVIVWYMAKYMGRIAEEKGLSPIKFQALLVLLWIMGEVGGFVLGNSIWEYEESFWYIYPTALGCAGIAAMLSILYVKLRPYQS